MMEEVRVVRRVSPIARVTYAQRIVIGSRAHEMRVRSRQYSDK